MKQIFFFAAITFCFTNAFSQHNDTAFSKWNFKFSAGIWNPSIRGDLTANSLPGYINITFKDKFKNPDYFLSAGFKARKNKLTLIAEFDLVNLNGEGTFVNSRYLYSRSHVKAFFVTAGQALDFYSDKNLKLELFGGFRWNYIINDIETYFSTGGSDRQKESRSFIDPVTGLGFKFRPFGKGMPGMFYLNGYFDTGGFGLVSFLSFRSYLGIGFDFNKNYSLNVGYRYLDVNYGLENYRFNAGIQGFELNAAVKFR